MTTTSDMPSAPAIHEPPRALERLEADLVELAGQLASAKCRFLLLVGEYDDREGWKSWGMTSTAAWLSWQCAVGATAAREQVRVARKMRQFPTIVAEFAAGRLSYSKVRAITRIVTNESVDTLVMWAVHATAAQIEGIAAGTRRAVRLRDAQARKSARSVSWRWDDDGSLAGSFRLPPEDAVRLLRALDLAKTQLPEPPAEVTIAEQTAQEDAEGPYGTASAEAPVARSRRVGSADALVRLANSFIESAERTGDDGNGLPGLGAKRHQLFIHATAETLARPDDTNDDGAAATIGTGGSAGVRIHPSTARRLTCDCVSRIQHDTPTTSPLRGNPLHLGRATRRIRGNLALAVHQRDHGLCQAPGCDRATTEIHHIRHWANGGLTCITNLISLCSHHHWLVHEGGWHIVGGIDGNWVFRDPDGRHLSLTPPRLAPASLLPFDATIPADAITGHWDGSGLNLNNAIGALLVDCVQ